MSRGRILVVEGLDGTGKTTLSIALSERLGGAWLTTPDPLLRAVREPIDTGWSVPARQLFYAGTVLEVAREALERTDAGQDVLIDRYWATTLTYAKALGEALALEEVEDRLPVADLTIFLDLDESERLRRLAERGETGLDRVATLHAARIRRGYLDALRRPVCGPVVVLQSTADPETLLEACLHHVERVVPRRVAALAGGSQLVLFRQPEALAG